MPPGKSCRAVLFLEKFFNPSDVFGHIHADGVVLDFRHANLPAIFEPAELLELFDALEFALRQRGILEEGFSLEDVEAEVFKMANLDFAGGVAHPGNGGA